MIKKILFTVLLFFVGVGVTLAQHGNVSGGSPLALITTTSTTSTTNTPTSTDGTDFGTTDIGVQVEHEFTFTSNLATQLLLASDISGVNADQFVIDAPVPSNITGIGTTSIIKVRFNPTSSGVKEAIVEIKARTFPPPGAWESYFFKIRAEANTPNPSIQIFGFDNLEITNNSFGPTVGDNTHYGDVVTNVESVRRQFTISNVNGTAPLEITGINGLNPEPNFQIYETGTTNPITFPLVPAIPAGSTWSFDIVFTPTSVSSISEFIEILNNDTDFYYEVIGIGIAAAPDMKVYGSGNLITSGDNTPDPADNTDFGSQDITSGTVQHTFTIKNEGTADLNLTSLSPIVNITGVGATEFAVITNPSTPIIGGSETTFVVEFDPSAVGTFDATISISNNGVDDPYTFAIRGIGTDVVVSGSPLLITQYYEGSANNQWIEVKNIGATATVGGVYKLALYANSHTRTSYIGSNPPDAVQSIGGIPAGGVLLYKNGGAAEPSGGNLGAAGIATPVCNFDGNDVVLISTSSGADCYSLRTDIVGTVGTNTADFWGSDIAYVKGCGTTELPSLVFTVVTVPGIGISAADYVRVSNEEVDTANNATNIALGTQVLGSTTWNGSWSNLTPDRTRDVTINGTYTAGNGSIDACNLVINGALNLDGGTTNYVDVYEDMTISGSFTIGDTESLINHNGATISGTITKQEITTQLVNEFDFTYWSSPVRSAAVNTVFAANNLDNVYYWDQSVANGIPGGSNGSALGEWINAAGLTMESGKGYIATGPAVGTYPLNQTISFSGIPYNGDREITNVFNNPPGVGDPEDDYNLVGNPYPSAIDADLFLPPGGSTNTTIDGTLWLWTHNAPIGTDPDDRYKDSDYASYNLSGGVASCGSCPTPTNNIGSGQGFMIRATEVGSSTIFNNAMRLKNENNQFFRDSDAKKSSSSEKDRVWINMETEGGSFNQILIGFFDKATDGYDIGYDGIKNSAGWASFYSMDNTVVEDEKMKYAIQGLSTFAIDKKVALGVDTYINEEITYKISISKMEGALASNEIYLVDNELNIIHDLKLASYEFKLKEEGNHPERFTLQFTKSTLGVDDFDLNNNFVVLKEDNGLRIKSSTTVSNIQVFDITGRLLIDNKPDQSEFVIDSKNIKKGTVLIINATFDNGAKLSKKAINY